MQWKQHLKTSSFQTYVPKIMVRLCICVSWDNGACLYVSWDNGAWLMDRQTDGQTNGWKKWHTEMAAVPKKECNVIGFDLIICDLYFMILVKVFTS